MKNSRLMLRIGWKAFIVIKEQKGAVRDAAITNLKQICPQAAVAAGY